MKNIILLFLIFCCTQSFQIVAQEKSQKVVYECSDLADNDLPQYIQTGKTAENTSVLYSIIFFTTDLNQLHGNPKEVVSHINGLGSQRKFLVSFVVNSKGGVESVESDAENAEVKQFLTEYFSVKNDLGRWIPGRKKNQNVNVKLYFHYGTQMGVPSIVPKVN